MRSRLGRWIRRIADSVDPAGKPHLLPAHTFTLEADRLRFREDGRGAKLWYIGEGQFAKARDESDGLAGNFAVRAEDLRDKADLSTLIRQEQSRQAMSRPNRLA